MINDVHLIGAAIIICDQYPTCSNFITLISLIVSSIFILGLGLSLWNFPTLDIQDIINISIYLIIKLFV
jgi:hypothetical protein